MLCEAVSNKYIIYIYLVFSYVLNMFYSKYIYFTSLHRMSLSNVRFSFSKKVVCKLLYYCPVHWYLCLLSLILNPVRSFI